MFCPSTSRKFARKQSLWKTGLLLNVYRSSHPFYCLISLLARLIRKDRKAKEGWQEDELQYPSPTKGCVSQPAERYWWPSPFADVPSLSTKWPHLLAQWLKRSLLFPMAVLRVLWSTGITAAECFNPLQLSGTSHFHQSKTKSTHDREDTKISVIC